MSLEAEGSHHAISLTGGRLKNVSGTDTVDDKGKALIHPQWEDEESDDTLEAGTLESHPPERAILSNQVKADMITSLPLLLASLNEVQCTLEVSVHLY
jgi:hypothetical protein